MTEYLSRRSLLRLAGSLTAGVAASRWITPPVGRAQSPDYSLLKAPDTVYCSSRGSWRSFMSR